jgi:4-amino-4-deoxy-L-arabinose transferase-like glycosyltransferase
VRTGAKERKWALLALLTAAALVLRLLDLGKLAPDPFYDAAVRSMGLSWHNFFFGAFEPGGSVSIDKPPVDLWLQVASVKALGFSSATLKLPQALAGAAAVPLLFVAVETMWSTSAALAAAAALAVLPIEVITARSDTMDAVMMALSVLALALVARSCSSGRTRWLLAGAAALGLAFDVKLLESLIALPGLALLAYLGLPGTRRRRLLQCGAAAAVYVAVALSWLTATLLFPAHERPWAIGSTNGSAWNAAFVFNGSDRISGKPVEGQFPVFQRGRRYPQATQAERDRIPIVPPSATRLLARIGPLSGQRLGLMLLIAIVLGAPALALGLRRGAEPEGDPGPPLRVRRAFAAGIAVWTLTGLVIFSAMARLHPRYVEGFTPAVAAMLGVGIAWAATPAGRARALILLAALAVTVYYVQRLEYAFTLVWWITLAAALCAVALACTQLASSSAAAERLQQPRSAAMLALTLAAVLALPLAVDVRVINAGIGDAGHVGARPQQETLRLSSYLRAHQGSARYELAAQSATEIGSLIVRDVRPVLILTTYNGRVFTGVPRLKRLIADGAVRYAVLGPACPHHPVRGDAACAAPSRWVRAHGLDVSRRAGLGRAGVLWLLSKVST